MIGKLRTAWGWFVEGLVDASVSIVDRMAGAKSFRLDLGEAEATLSGAGGRVIDRLSDPDGPARLTQGELGRRLSGAAIDVVVPSAWMFRRELDAVALESRPFLDAFVRHQIERITPWRVGDTHYRILERPISGDATRIAVGLALVPRRLVARWITGLEPLHPKVIRLRTADGPTTDAILLGGDRPRLAAVMRQWVLLGLGAGVILVAAAAGWLQWQSSLVQADLDDQDRLLTERKAVLARARGGADPVGSPAGRLHERRAGKPLAVAVIDALSSALPDTAHLTSLQITRDHVTIAGVSTDPSSLVPALEASGAFAAVVFASATARTEAGDGERFSLDMSMAPAHFAHPTAPAGGEVSASRDPPPDRTTR